VTLRLVLVAVLTVCVGWETTRARGSHCEEILFNTIMCALLVWLGAILGEIRVYMKDTKL